ncbi:hypothetical protein [Cytobacillus sp. IB215665]|uniref:hypothetical protein n=1 Tax=Cytobacillus sp. IB215665 TaxID=3097357 RepID=UPI002A10FBAC|nr:hypothetical protein [Cytobacillus sp. IB215665]MDX8366883.1 hypothetical protein [Cytobacillus sp. IB215665]
MINQREVEQLIDKTVAKYMSEFSKQIESLLTADLRNENGNSKIIKSGNSFVYVDNSAVAYAIVLLFQHFSSNGTTNHKDIQGLVDRLEGMITHNREELENLVQSFKEE